MLYSIGMLAGPPVMGLGMDAFGPRGFFFTIVALIALYLGVVATRKGAALTPPVEAARRPLRPRNATASALRSPGSKSS